MTQPAFRSRLRQFRRQARFAGDIAFHEHQADDITGGTFGDVNVAGDIVAEAWNGARPADLSSAQDPNATGGFYFDSSAGNAQFNDEVYIGGGSVGISWIEGSTVEARIRKYISVIAFSAGNPLTEIFRVDGDPAQVSVSSYPINRSFPAYAFGGDLGTGIGHDSGGNGTIELIIGGTSRMVLDYFLGCTIHQNQTAGASPVLTLDQDDIDEPFINFDGTTASDGSRSISTDTTEDSAKYGAVMVEINGTKKWIRIYDNES